MYEKKKKEEKTKENLTTSPDLWFSYASLHTNIWCGTLQESELLVVAVPLLHGHPATQERWGWLMISLKLLIWCCLLLLCQSASIELLWWQRSIPFKKPWGNSFPSETLERCRAINNETFEKIQNMIKSLGWTFSKQTTEAFADSKHPKHDDAVQEVFASDASYVVLETGLERKQKLWLDVSASWSVCAFKSQCPRCWFTWRSVGIDTRVESTILT